MIFTFRCKTYVAAKTRFKSVDKMWLFSFLELDGLSVIFDTLNTLAKQKVKAIYKIPRYLWAPIGLVLLNQKMLCFQQFKTSVGDHEYNFPEFPDSGRYGAVGVHFSGKNCPQ